MLINLTRKGRDAVIDTHGGELVSYKDEKRTEYIWHGDPAYWGGRNPVLFPIVGSLENGRIQINGKTYEMARHGFARRMEFSVVEQKTDYAVLELCANEESRKQYPFDFRLRVRQELIENGFRTSFTVENAGDEAMPFCIGAHTAFNCPLYAGENFEDYVVKFDHIENVPSRIATPEGYIHASDTQPCLENSDGIPLRHEIFDEADTLTFDGLKSTAAELINPATGRGVRMEFDGFPMFAIWTMPHKNAPYVCLEPWLGCAHVTDESEDFNDKLYRRILKPGETADFSYGVFVL